jgi:Uma2 family endonuclease
MVAAVPLDLPAPPGASERSHEPRFVLHGIPWHAYATLREADDTPGLRMTYDRGELELMSPSPEHEDLKTTIARLIETYALERDVPLYGYGSTTFRREAKAAGLEPDECYCLGGKLNDVPDIAIEVVVTSGGIEKLPIYARLGVPEVWLWENETFTLHALRDGVYEAVAASAVLPDLDIAAVARFARLRDQHQAVKGFRDWLRSGLIVP